MVKGWVLLPVRQRLRARNIGPPQLSRYLEDDQRYERIALGLLSGCEKKEVSVQGSSAETDAFQGLVRGR